MFFRSMDKAINEGVKEGLDRVLPKAIHKAMDAAVAHDRKRTADLLMKELAPKWLLDAMKAAGMKFVRTKDKTPDGGAEPGP